MAIPTNVSESYLKSLGKSFGYASLSVFEKYNPTLTNIYKSGKEVIRDINRSSNEERKEEAKEAKVSYSNIIDNLYGDSWYNREEQDNNDANKSSDVASEDWGDSADIAKNIVKDNTIKNNQLKKSIYGSTDILSSNIGIASVKSAEYIVRSANANYRSLYRATAGGFDRVTKALLGINNTLTNMSEFNKNQIIHMKNSTTFFITTTNTLNKMNSNLEKLVELQTSANELASSKKIKNSKNDINSIVNNRGEIDLVKYTKFVLSNISDYKNIGKSKSSGTNSASSSSKSATRFIGPEEAMMAQIINQIMPNKMKKQMLDMNQVVKDVIIAGLAGASERTSRSKNPIANILGNIFLPQSTFKSSVSNSKYEKGQVAWDGIARKSLTEVIPTYLAKIYAALGGEEQYFDYESGKFVKLSKIKSDYENEQKIYAVRAGGAMRTDILSQVRNSNSSNKVKVEREVENFFLKAFLDGYDFTEITQKANDKAFLKKYGLSKESAKYIADYIKSKGNSKNSINFAANVYRGRNEYGNKMRQAEISGTSNLNYMSNGFTTEQDNFNKSQAYYLRGIYTMVGNMYGLMNGYTYSNNVAPIVNPNRRSSGRDIFDPDTGRYRRSARRNHNRQPAGRERSNMDRSRNDIYKTDENGISIEDRAKYLGMSDDEILEIKRKNAVTQKAKDEYRRTVNNIIDSFDRNRNNGNNSSNNNQTANNARQTINNSGRRSLSEKVKDIYQAPYVAMTDLINSFSDGINKLFYGNENKSGLIDKVSEFLDKQYKRIFGDQEKGTKGIGIVEATKEEWGKIKSKYKDRFKNFFGNIRARDRAAHDREMAQAVYNQMTGSDDIPGHARGKQITKTGLIAVSKGELVIPSELNPYYNGTTNKNDQIRQENNVINKFYGSFAKGGTVGGNNNHYAFDDGEFKIDTDPKTGKKIYKYIKPDGTVIRLRDKSQYAKLLAQRQIRKAEQKIKDNSGAATYAKDILGEGANTLGGGIFAFIKQSLFGDEKQQEKDKKAINLKVTDIFKEMGLNQGAMGVGAVAGIGTSLLTGALVGPLAGAAIGAGVGLVAKSEKLQKALFGEPDKDGNYEKPIANFIMKKLPSIGESAGVGLVGGTLLGSPLLGAIVGAGVGFASKSDKVKDFLFGSVIDDKGTRAGGILNKEVQAKIKKAMPNIAAGALAGMIAGPFGLLGNMAVGAGIGYLSTGENFKKYFFGDGKDDKGLAGIIHDKIVNGLDSLIHDTSNALKGFGRKLFKRITNKIDDGINKAKNAYNNGTARGIQKAVGWAANVPGRAIKGATNFIGDRVQGLAARRRAKNLEQGYDVWNAEEKRNATAAERIAMRSETDDTSANAMDKVIAGADAEQLAEIRNLIKNVQDPGRKFNNIKNKNVTTLYAALDEAGVDRKTAKRIVQNAGGENGSTRVQELLQGKNYSQETLDKINKAFGSANTAIVNAADTKNIAKGNITLLKDKYGIDLEGKNKNLNIENILKQIDYEDKIRFSNPDSNIEEKTEKYQDNVVSLLTDLNNNIKLGMEFISGKRTKEGRYETQIDKDGNVKYVQYGENGEAKEVSSKEAIEGAKKQRNILERVTDVSNSVTDKTEEVIKAVKDPIIDVTKDAFTALKEDVIEPLANSAKELVKQTSEIAKAGLSGYAGENPEIDTSEYYGPKSDIDIINSASRLKLRGKYLGRRLVAGFKAVKNATRVSNNTDEDIEGKAEGGSGKSSFMDLLAGKLLSKFKGNSDEDKTSSGEIVKTDMFGNIHQYTRNNQGELTEATNDSDTKESRGIINKFTNSINKIPGIMGAIGGLTGLIKLFKNKLLGDDKKEKGILGKMFDKFFGEDGMLSGLFGFFTGKNGIGSKILSGLNLGSVLTNVVAPALLLGGLGGRFDQVAHDITNGGYGTGKDSKTATDKETGETLTQKVDKNGVMHWYNSNGQIVDDSRVSDVNIKATGSKSFSSALKYNAVRGVLTNTKSVTSTVLGKTAIGKAATKFVKDNAGDLGSAIFVQVDDILKSLAKKLAKVPMLKNVDLDGMFGALSSKLASGIESQGAKLAKLASNAVVIAKVAFAVVDFTTGYEDASTTLGVKDPSIGEKIVSGVLRAVKNCIPILGTLIPDKTVVDIFVKYIFPAIGLDVSEFNARRDEATAEAKAAGYDNWSDYNKSVRQDYTWTERIGNAAKSTVADTKQKIKNIGSGIKEKGIGGYLKDSVSGMTSQFMSSYKDNGGGVAGVFSGIGDTFGSMLPGVLGDIAKAKGQITSFAAKGQLKDIWSVTIPDFDGGKDIEGTDMKTAVPGIFSRAIGQVPLLTTKLAFTPFALISKLGVGVGNVIKGMMNKVNNTFDLMGKAEKSGEDVIYGKKSLKEFLNVSDITDDPENPVGGITKALVKASRLIAVVPVTFRKIGNDFKTHMIDPVIKTVTTAADNISQNQTKLNDTAKQGSVSALWKLSMQDSEGNPLGGLYKGVDFVQKLSLTIPTLFYGVGNKISDFVNNVKDTASMDGYNKAVDQMQKYSYDGNLSGVSRVAFTPSDGVISKILSGVFGVQKKFYQIMAIVNKLGNGAKQLAKDAGEWIGDKVDKAGQAVNGAKDYVVNGANNLKNGAVNAAKGAWNSFSNWISGSGSGFVSQFDPRYQQYKVSGQNFGAKGCGPAVATMAARALGKNMSVSDAVNDSNGYQTDNGVTLDYFQNALGSKGINTRYIAGGSSNDLYNSIANGDKVVLLGRDPQNTSKDNSPFGPNNHYVLATGLDKRGNVIVNDPESNGPRAYNPSILNSAKYGIAGSNSGIRKNKSPRRTKFNRYLSNFSGGDSYDTDVARQVWAYFTGAGYSPAATAGIMGNMYAESAMNPTAIQGNGKGPAAGICQWENYNTKSGRWAQLDAYAKSKGKDWTDLDCQLNFVNSELNTKDISNRMAGKTSPNEITKTGLSISNAMTFDEWKKCTDVKVATCLFEAAFERAGKVAMQKRITAATAYYNLYSGSHYEYTGEYDANALASSRTAGTSGSTGSSLFSNIFNVVGDIGTVFSNAFSGITGNSSSGTSGSFGASNASGDFAVSNATVGDGNATQKALANKLLGIQGTLKYSMTGARNPEQGSADCSSTVNWAYKKVTGTDIGNSTDAIINSNATEPIDVASNMNPQTGGTNSSGPNVSKLMPGDILLYSRPTSDYSKGRKYRVGHVEMYLGNGNRIGHGGGIGPKVSPISTDSNRYIEARRLKGITASAAGSGLLPMSYEELANASGGSSGILMKSRAGSRNNMMMASGGNRRLSPNIARRTSGGASDITTQTKEMLTNISNRTRSTSSEINPQLVAELLKSITNILNNIAANTAPVEKIYQVLSTYINAGGASGLKSDNKVVVNKKNNSNSSNQPSGGDSGEIDSNISTLVGVLAELAKG